MPPTYHKIREFAEQLLEGADLQTSFGENWHKNFLKRHKNVIKPAKKRAVDLDRILACNSQAINLFFDRFEAIMKEYKVHASNIWNMDESGLQSNKPGSGKIVTANITVGDTAVGGKPARAL
jgi:hypothetical protein